MCLPSALCVVVSFLLLPPFLSLLCVMPHRPLFDADAASTSWYERFRADTLRSLGPAEFEVRLAIAIAFVIAITIAIAIECIRSLWRIM